MRVGDLREALRTIPDDADVATQDGAGPSLLTGMTFDPAFDSDGVRIAVGEGTVWLQFEEV